MPVRRYLTEYAVNMFGDSSVLLQQEQLEDQRVLSALPNVPYHIYMIARRPRIALDPSTRISDNTLVGNFMIQRGHNWEQYPLSIPIGGTTSQPALECPFPHTEFLIRDAGVQIAAGKVAHLISGFVPEHRALMDLEVLYVGQAFGDDGSRTAPDRLKSHSTLQSIYAEAIQRAPDKEIWIILWYFEPMLITSIDGRSQVYGTSVLEDEQHRNKVHRFEITDEQQICFTEAALIRYFKPEYNVLFKGTFPNPAHSTYAQCYELDLNVVNVELPTEPLKSRLWSPSAPPAWTHFAQFHLHSRDERKSMFDLDL